MLRNKTRRWITTAGGVYRKGVSKVQVIGGSLARLDPTSEHYRVNADKVLAYLLKHATIEAGQALGLPRYGRSGKVLGKRFGWAQNIGVAARRSYRCR